MKIQYVIPGHLSLSLRINPIKEEGFSNVGLAIKVLLCFCYLSFYCSWDSTPPFDSPEPNLYVIDCVVSSCIDVACHVNIHFGLSMGENKEALFHKFLFLSFLQQKSDSITSVRRSLFLSF